MSLLLLSDRDLLQALSLDDCREAVGAALREFSAGDVGQPVRQFLDTPSGGRMGVMPGCLSDGTAGLKAITIFGDNAAVGKPSHQGVVLLFEPHTGTPIAAVEASSLTALRTAAASAVATEHLARREARSIAILGAGVQARSHLEALYRVRPIEEVRIWNRTQSHALQLRDETRSKGKKAEIYATAEQAVRGADIVCTTTASPTPIVHGDWLARGTHVNAVGAYQPHTRELDSEAIRRSSVWVDSRESAIREAGEIVLAVADRQFELTAINGEIGELVGGDRPGRKSSEEITLFKSLGLAAEDLAAARTALRRAQELGLGTKVELQTVSHTS